MHPPLISRDILCYWYVELQPYGTRATIKNLQYLPNCSYIMNVELAPNLAAVTTNWQIAIITSKLEDDTKIQLHVENE